MHSCLCLRSLLRIDESMLERGSMSCHMYFLKPRPRATSLKHCLQKFSPYLLIMGPYCPHRLHGLLPLPNFLDFLGLILAVGTHLRTWVLKLFCMKSIASSLET